VDDGLTGFVTDDVDGMVAAIARIGEIDRAACRRAAEARFDAERMVDDYERAYETVIELATAPR
jgi:glycosyltransferase involved in cell wall biosynthesis